MGRRDSKVVLVLWCAALLAIPTVPAIVAVPADANGASDSGVLPGFASHLPAVLALPWAQRAGYDPARLAEISFAIPATDPAVSVAVSFWPRDASFFSPTPGAAPMTNDQIRDRFGPLPADYRAVLDYFHSHGLVVTHEWPDNLSVTVQGSAQEIGTAFGTGLIDGIWQGRIVRMPLAAPTLPPSITSMISSVSGLSSGFTHFSVPLRNVAPDQVVPGRTSPLLWPSAVHSLYGLDGLYNYSGSPHWATGVGIALVLWGQGYAPNDILSFFSNYYPAGFPAIHFSAFPQDGAPMPSANAVNDPSNVTSEMTLDMEWAGSAAPGATLYAVYAPDGPKSNGYSPADVFLEHALDYAVTKLPQVRVVSMSFGTPDGSDPTFQAAFTQILSDAQLRGITVLAASGDTGGTARNGCQGAATAEFPAASEYVVAVGGTAPLLAVNTFGGVTGLDSEPAWNRSGGGYSATVPAPSWQKVGSAAGPVTQHGFRGIPDVAGPASDNVFFYNGQEAAGAGTSFAAPMWAGIIAEMDAIRGQPLGFVTPRLYAVGAEQANRSSGFGLVDITQGSNCLGPATTGWDTATGWGSPRGLLLLQELSGTFVDVALTVSTTTVAPGQTFDALVHVRNATSLAPIGSVSVVFTLGSVDYVGPCGGTVSSASTSTSATGDASGPLTVPGCYLGLSLQIVATVSGGPYFGSNTTTVQINLVGIAGFLAVIQQPPYNWVAFGVIMTAAILLGWRIGTWRDGRRRRARRAPTAPPAVPRAAPTPSSVARPAAATTPGAGSTAAATTSSGPPPTIAPRPSAPTPAPPRTAAPANALPVPRAAPPRRIGPRRVPTTQPRPGGVAAIPRAASPASTAPPSTPSPATGGVRTPTAPPPTPAPPRSCAVCQTPATSDATVCSFCGASLW